MALPTTTPPAWYSFSHHDRYRRLQKVRRVWGRCHYGKQEDICGRIVHLDGTRITDVPSFHLSLGEAVNGPNGYFGGCLDALSDCLCGDFGVLPPLTIRLSHFDEVRDALDDRAWARFRAESFHEAVANGANAEELVSWGYFPDDSEAAVARWTATYAAALAGEPFDLKGVGSYFDAVLEVFVERGVELIPVNDAASE